MTPDDVAAIRAQAIVDDDTDIVFLCDALEAAWAERDGLARALDRVHDELDRANEMRMFDEVFKRIRRAATVEQPNG